MEEKLLSSTTKNIKWNFITTLITKISGLIFTIILARFLLPEYFGIYNLALSIAIIAMIFTDAGINNTAIRYISEKIGKKDKKSARSFFRYIFYLKSLSVLIIVSILFLISNFLSVNVFEKPILFIPIVSSVFYIIFLSFNNFFKTLLVSFKDLKRLTFSELVFEASKILFALVILYFFSNEFAVAGVFIGIALAASLSLITIFIFFRKKKYIFFGPIEKIEKKRILEYLWPMVIASFSLVLFGSIDTLMLGRFVDAEYIGYYRVALSLIFTTTALLGFSNVLFPLLTQIHGKTSLIFKRASRYITMFATPALFGMMIVGKYFIMTIYGKEYLIGTMPLYFLALMIIINPLTDLYALTFQSKEKTKPLSKYIVVSLFINILLNYLLIKYLLNFSQEFALVGAAVATIISRAFYLFVLGINSKKLFKTSLEWIFFFKSLAASIIMAIILISFQHYLNMNIFLGILEILLGVFIYFSILWVFKGLNKQDFKLIRIFLKK